jgi:beta-N-acetylhexosaminidase
MEMKAIAAYFGTVKAAVYAVKAGADIVCLSHHKDLQIEGAKAIKKAVEMGEIPESRIDESVDRIIRMKKKYNLFQKPYPDMDKVDNVVGSTPHRAFAESVSQRSITVLKDKDNLLPVKQDIIASISTEPVTLTGADDTIYKRSIFCEAVREQLGGYAYTIPLDPDASEIKS